MPSTLFLRKCTAAIIIILFIGTNAIAQNSIKNYAGHWEGILSSPQNFSIKISIKKIEGSLYALKLDAGGSSVLKKFKCSPNNSFEVKPDSNLRINGTIGKGQKEIRLMIHSMQWTYHTALTAQKNNEYTGRWNIFLTPDFRPEFYVSVEASDTDTTKYEAYCFSADTRFSGFVCGGLTQKLDSIHFTDFRTGTKFKGKLSKDTITLRATMAGINMSSAKLHRSVTDWNLSSRLPKRPFNNSLPASLTDGLPVSTLKAAGFDDSYLKLMVDSINANKITNTHSVLISRNGKLVYEQYFNGFDEATVHDMRSASKSISSALVGIAIDKSLLKDTAQKLISFLPQSVKQLAEHDARKKAISIGNLLTMSSGLDAIDFGIDRKSMASEDEYQSSANWFKTVIEAPMISYPGIHANYGTANPYLLGIVMDTVVKQALDAFIDQQLFEPLGIRNYVVFNDPLNRPYFGGGMHMRPRDMLKFGLLYANRGKWKNRQVVSKNWVDASFKKYLILENHPEKNEYGFLWWHYHYLVNGKTINTIEARGAGGQYIFIVPQYQLVVVITSANFRNGRVWQPEKILENYILPAIKK